MKSFLYCTAVVMASCVSCAVSYGQSLSWLSISGVPSCITVKEGAGGKLFAASDGSTHFDGVVYSSSDDGQSWYPTAITYGWIFEVVAHEEHIIVTRYLANSRFPYQVFLSDDNGGTWKGIMSGDIFPNPFSGFMYSDSGEIYAISGFGNSQLVKLIGQSWRLIGSQFPPVSFNITAFFNGTAIPAPTAIDHDGRIYVGTISNGLYTTSDYGVTWKQSLAGLRVTAVTVRSPQIVVGTSPNIARNGGVFVSADTGSTWTFLGLAEQNITALAIDETGGIYATSTTGVYRYGGTPNSWDNISPSPEAFGGVEVSKSHVYLAASIAKGVFRSTDNGQSWGRSGIPKEDIGSLLLTSQGTLVAGSYGDRVFVTNNNGGTWGQTFPGSLCDNVYALLEAPPRIFAATDCGVFSSADAGRTWLNASQLDISGGAFALSKDSQGKIYAGTNFGVLASNDNGNTWNQRGLADYKVTGLAVNNLDELFALTALNGVFALRDTGRTWAGLGLVRNDLQSITVNPSNTLLVGADGGIYMSSDEGASWPFSPVTNAFIYSLAVTDQSTIVAGTGNGIFVSINGGASWAQRNAGLNQTIVLSLGVDAQGYLYAGTLHGGVYKSTNVLTDVRESVLAPSSFGLLQNYPNPFNPSTSIEFHLSHPAFTTIEVFNVMGQRVATLVNGFEMPGIHKVIWDASTLPSGIYLCRLKNGAAVESRKMLLLR